MPPEIPPELLDSNPSGEISSLLTDPLRLTTSIPLPISTALTH